MDTNQISSLAKLLRDSGDKVLNANFKLTLSGSLLRSLNDSFTMIADQDEIYPPQTFQVVKSSNSKSDVFRDLQFIHDFVQKTKILLITQFANDDSFESCIDISKFRNLRRLELHKVLINQVIGIQQMRAHLQEIVCTRSIDSVKDIISHCGGDKSNGFVWNELKFADFSYNQLITIDCCLEFVPWLQHLNLSHNHLVSVDAIKWLPNLKYLNLSFNRLTHIPMFNMDTSKKLKILILSSNYIEDIAEISRLDSLTDLDLSGNCLMDHSYLLPLSTLISLSYINLEGNPLACHSKHRQGTARYLHKNTSTVNFILDKQPLSKSEKALSGTYQSYHLILTSRISMGSFSRRSSGQPTPTKFTKDNSSASSISSSSSFALNSSKMFDSTFDDMSSSIVTQKRVKPREAIIADIHEDCQPSANTTTLSLEGNKDYLEVKKQIEDLRSRLDSDWLYHAENLATNNVNVDNININEKRMARIQIETDLQTIEIDTPPIEKCSSEFLTNKNKEITSEKQLTKYHRNYESENDNEIKRSERNIESQLSPKTQTQVELNQIYTTQASMTSEGFSDAEENEITYIVHLEPNNDEIFLVISDLSIREKDIFTGRTKNKWSIKLLESCDQIQTDVLRLNFDTIKKDKKERIYKIETGQCQSVENFLRNILSKRPLSEMNLTLYRCANCATQFSRDNIYKNQNIDLCCPECQSSYIIEIKETSRAHSVEKTINQPSLPNFSQILDKKKMLENCESFSSTGSVASLNESSSCSKISKSEDSFDSNQSVAGSSTGDRDLDLAYGTNGESDIEILSNPSQSSIEVLDNFHSGRKYSDERRISQVPSLDTIADNSYNSPKSVPSTLVNQQTSTRDLSMTSSNAISPTIGSGGTDGNGSGRVQLTESSSSGSVTDSICTTYEQQQNPSDTLTDGKKSPKSNKSPEKIPKSESSVISAMLGGLFQSTNNLMSRTQKSNETIDIPFEEFKYSYDDFDNADHRLKAFFYQNIFEDDNEQFKWLVKGRILNDNQIDDKSRNTIFCGMFLMSTTKFYIFQIVDKERDDISKWLKRTLSGTIDRVEVIRVLPWKIGITLTIKNIGNIFLFLQDISRTDSLLLYFANNPLPDYCTLEYKISERLSQKLLKTTENIQLKMLAILNQCEISVDNNLNSEEYSAFIITETNLYLTNSTHKWITDKSVDDSAEIYHSQFMSNLIEVERLNALTIRIHFFDENQGKNELWTCIFETNSNADSTLNAISQSWEKLFSVPLGIN